MTINIMNIGTIIENMLKQTCVYWGSPTPSGYANQSTYADAVEISCRWSLKKELYRNQNGEEELSDALVTVSQDLDIGGFLYLGDLNDLDSSPEPMASGAFEIRAFEKIPSVDGTKFLRRAYLSGNKSDGNK